MPFSIIAMPIFQTNFTSNTNPGKALQNETGDIHLVLRTMNSTRKSLESPWDRKCTLLSSLSVPRDRAIVFRFLLHLQRRNQA